MNKRGGNAILHKCISPTLNLPSPTSTSTLKNIIKRVFFLFIYFFRKYENCKLQVQLLKNSDESLRRDIAINEDTIQKQEQKYEALKNFAMGQIEKYVKNVGIVVHGCNSFVVGIIKSF